MFIYTKQDDFNKTLSQINKIKKRIEQNDTIQVIKEKVKLLKQVEKTPSIIYRPEQKFNNLYNKCPVSAIKKPAESFYPSTLMKRRLYKPIPDGTYLKYIKNKIYNNDVRCNVEAMEKQYSRNMSAIHSYQGDHPNKFHSNKCNHCISTTSIILLRKDNPKKTRPSQTIWKNFVKKYNLINPHLLNCARNKLFRNELFIQKPIPRFKVKQKLFPSTKYNNSTFIASFSKLNKSTPNIH